MRALTKVIITVIIFFFVSNCFAQEYYPLKTGNLWQYYHSWWDPYGGQGGSYYFTVNVIGDTLFPNGEIYSVLSRADLTGGEYVRADSNYIYYYNIYSEKEDTIYKLNAQIGEKWYPESEIAWSVELVEIDSIFIFDNLSRVLRYRVDGLILRWITLSDKFGPYHEYSPGEPPGTTNWTSTVHYCIINGIEYGNPVSINMNQNIPGAFILHQNYPNPFNPTTTIKYQIPEISFVTIIVYDVLGSEVATLVNEEKPVGNYEVEFNAASLPSGIYFYRLQAGSFVETKKMVLMK